MREQIDRVVLAILVLWWMPQVVPVAARGLPQGGDRARIEQIVARIQRADYEGDRAGLERLERELSSVPEGETALASRQRYWQGFARWRRAINGFNDAAPPAELDADLRAALRHFDEALRLDPAFVDATVGRLSCAGYLMFLAREDAKAVDALMADFRPQAEAAVKAAPDNPRLIWVLGPGRWFAASRAPEEERPARQAETIAAYERGLALTRAQKDPAQDPLQPTWGEAELLMSLAWSHLNKVSPDVAAAEQHANAALALVPYWHYVRDILLPQIRSARC